VDGTIPLTVDDQGRHGDGGQKGTYIRFVGGLHPCSDLIGASVESYRAGEPGPEAFVGDPAGDRHLQVWWRSPRFFHRSYGSVEVLARYPPGVVVLSHVVGIAVYQNKGADQLGIGDCEVDRRGAEHSDSYHRRTLKTHSVQQRGDISVENISGQEVPWVALGCTHASGVEPDGTAESVQPPADPDDPRVLEQQIDRNRDAVQEHQL
jgi:hypothetical protein